MQTIIKTITTLFLFLTFFALHSCQKLINVLSVSTDSSLPANQLWVLKTKSVHYFKTSLNPYEPDQTENTYFSYDGPSRTISITDTIPQPGGAPYNFSRTFTYDANGKLIDYNKSVKIVYNTNGLPDMISYYNSGIHGNDWKFAWSAGISEFSGVMSDPSDKSTPYSEGNRTFRVSKEKRLVEQLYVATDPAENSEKTLCYRNSDGDVSNETIGYGKQGTYNVRDSIIYERDKGYPTRLYDFYHFWSGGLDWLEKGGFAAVGFTEPLFTHFNESFENDKTIVNKISYYTRDIDINPLSASYRLDYTNIFQTQYDSNKNPVKITVSTDGIKVIEISFVWQVIKW